MENIHSSFIRLTGNKLVKGHVENLRLLILFLQSNNKIWKNKIKYMM